MSFFIPWASIALVSLMASMVPGISFALVLRNTLNANRSIGIWTALGLALGMSIYVIIVLCGFSFLMLKHPSLTHCIEWAGAIYLAYIGVTCLRAKPKILAINSSQSLSLKTGSFKALSMGFFTNLLNPKVMLFFLALFTQFINQDTPNWIIGIYGLTAVFIEFIWFSTVAIILTHSILQRKFEYISHWIERIAGIVLLAISLRLVIMQFS